MSVTPSIFKAYDVRGIYPDEFDESVAELIGQAFVTYLNAKRLAVARDMRLSSNSLAAAFIEGARTHGADIVDYGLASTDMLYYGVSHDKHDGGAMITASHNPSDDNGIKFFRHDGYKLDDTIEQQIETLVFTGEIEHVRPTAGEIG